MLWALYIRKWSGDIVMRAGEVVPAADWPLDRDRAERLHAIVSANPSRADLAEAGQREDVWFGRVVFRSPGASPGTWDMAAYTLA